MLRIISGLLTPDGGMLEVAGQIGVVPQEIALYEVLTAHDNLQIFGSLSGMRGPSLTARIREVLAAVGLEDRAQSKVKTFSGGMKRRLNLAVGLLADPPILLLDEPTVGVDPQSRARIFELLRALNAAGKTLIYTTHYMEEAERLCRRIGIIDHGRLLAEGTLHELLARVSLPRVVRVYGEMAETAPALDFATLVREADHVDYVPAAPEQLGALVSRIQESGLRYDRLEITGPSLRDALSATDREGVARLIRRILTLIRKDFRIFLADPVALGLGFIVPLVMILVFGLVFGGSGGGLDEMSVLGVNEDDGPAGKRLLRSLDALEEIQIVDTLRGDSLAVDSVRARRRVESGRNSVALVVPHDFSEGLKKGEVRLWMLEDPKDPLTGGVVSGLLQRQVFQEFPGLMPMSMMNTGYSTDSVVARSFNADLRRAVEKNFGLKLSDSLNDASMFPEEMLLGSDPDTSRRDTADSGFSFEKALGKMFKVTRVQVVGQNIVNPGIAQSVAGPAVMFMLFAVGAIAASLLREMRDGTTARLRVLGARPGELLVSKYLWAVLLGSVQLSAMMLYGRLLFHLDIFSHPFSLLLMIVSTALVMSAVGLIIAAIGRTEEQATGYQVTIILAMSAIGGAMIPSFIMPVAVRSISVVTPVHWAMEGFHDIFWRNQSLAGILPEVGVLLGMAALLVTISVLIFRRRLRTELG